MPCPYVGHAFPPKKKVRRPLGLRTSRHLVVNLVSAQLSVRPGADTRVRPYKRLMIHFQHSHFAAGGRHADSGLHSQRAPLRAQGASVDWVSFL